MGVSVTSVRCLAWSIPASSPGCICHRRRPPSWSALRRIEAAMVAIRLASSWAIQSDQRLEDGLRGHQ